MYEVKLPRTLDKLLKRYGMEAIRLDVELNEEGTSLGRYSVRVIVPTDPSWSTLLLANGWHRRGDLDSHILACDLVQLNELVSLGPRKNRRRLRFHQLRREFRDARLLLQHTGSDADLAQKLAGEVSEPIDTLLGKARYPNAPEALPVDEHAYEEFRETVLEEMENFERWLEQQCAERAIDQVQIEKLQEGFLEESLRKITKKVLTEERARGQQLEPLAERAEALLMEAERRHAANPSMPFHRLFDWGEVNPLLDDAVVKLREVHGQESADSVPEIQDLERIRREGSAYDKAAAVQYVWRSLRDRSPLFETLMLEVDFAESYLIGQASRQLYREIRPFLTLAEKRLFALMFFQQLPQLGGAHPTFPLGDTIFWLDPILHGLAEDDRIVALVILVLGFKVKHPREDLSAELERRVKAYLGLYPYWIEMTRDRERFERKTRREEARRRILPDMERVRDPCSPQAAPKKGRTDRYSEFQKFLSDRGLVELMEECGIPDRRGIARMVWRDKQTQKDVARRLEITPQAVSARVRRMMRALIKKMQERGHLPPGVRLPKGRWTPRG